MTCLKCDKGRVPLGMVFYDKEIGFNTGGEGEFFEYEMGDCPCCNGEFESCQICVGLTMCAADKWLAGVLESEGNAATSN